MTQNLDPGLLDTILAERWPTKDRALMRSVVVGAGRQLGLGDRSPSTSTPATAGCASSPRKAWSAHRPRTTSWPTTPS